MILQDNVDILHHVPFETAGVLHLLRDRDLNKRCSFDGSTQIPTIGFNSSDAVEMT